MKAELGILDVMDTNIRDEIVQELMNLEQIERSHLKQKSKIKWAIEGDENTHFFHMTVNNNLREKKDSWDPCKRWLGGKSRRY